MSTASVLIAADHTDSAAPDAPRYTLLLSADPELIEAAQRLRHDVFTSEPGFTLTGAADGRDADRFDELCDHLLVREDRTGELVGCYRMLPPPGAIAAGGLYTATEFDVRGLDALRPSWSKWAVRWCGPTTATVPSSCSCGRASWPTWTVPGTTT